jgi:hypothetical protein
MDPVVPVAFGWLAERALFPPIFLCLRNCLIALRRQWEENQSHLICVELVNIAECQSVNRISSCADVNGIFCISGLLVTRRTLPKPELHVNAIQLCYKYYSQ